MTKENMIRYYRKYSGADAYILGFFYKHDLFMVKMPEILPRFIKVRTASSRNGGGEKLQFELNNKFKEQLINRHGAIKIGKDTDLNEIQRNKGVSFERMVYRYYGLEPRERDNVRFTEGGDLRVNGEEIQVKFEKAQIVAFSTIHKIQKERRKGRK